MAVTLKITTTKPEGMEWYGRSSPEAAAIFVQIEAWMETLPGFLGHTQTIIDANTRAQEIKFDTLENYQNYREVRMTNAAWLARSEYNDSNGVTLALEEIID
jgi:antibiotic biosynthesis monooxygenase (ABM) superfamily enzyme